MSRSSFVTVSIARFDELTASDSAWAVPPAGAQPLMWAIGADELAAGADFGSRQAYSWIAFGLHSTAESADAVFAASDVTPIFSGAVETWSAVLQPYAHHGVVNWLDRNEPGLAFEVGPKPETAEPFVVITSSGWTLDHRFDVDKAIDFGRGAAAVRSEMDSADGLYFQHGFNFSGMLDVDGPTVTMWRDDVAARAFAFKPGTHKTEMDHFRAHDTADRLSFTRLRVLRSRGSVRGHTPVAIAQH